MKKGLGKLELPKAKTTITAAPWYSMNEYLLYHRSRAEYKEEFIMKEIKGLKYIGEYEDEDYGTLPLYDMDGFINTAEGWSLLGKLKDPKHPEYVAAKAAYEAKEAVGV